MSSNFKSNVVDDRSLVLPSVSVVIPVYNEEANIDKLMERCLNACSGMNRKFELVLVDDGSSDASREKIRKHVSENPGAVRGIFLNRNYGQHAAILAGFNRADGDFLITIDADLQNPPEAIPELVNEMDKGFDVVGSIRRARCDSFFRTFSSRMVNKVVRTVTGVKMRDYGCMLRAYRRHIVAAILECKDNRPFIPVLANSFAATSSEIEISHAARAEGESKYNVWKLISLQFDLLTGMSTLPLRLLSISGAILAIAGILFGLLLLVLRLAFGTEWAADGVFTLFSGVFVLVGLQFFGLGLLGEYIGRIAWEVRERPRYLIQEEVGSSEESKFVVEDGIGRKIA